ncbi:MAG TPA: sigma-70 family RNA polymerase sigma factor [Gemmataceae bacterium]|jgi:RNA polymerase sigma-70 factor (ECF subfamily)
MNGQQLSLFVRQIRNLIGPSTVSDTTDADLLQRFAMRHEEAAFAAILERHGPLVLGVCRRVLDDTHDAEDAFQATFLVLARRASSIRRGASLASWLYGVAYRVAREARIQKARRSFHEKEAATRLSQDGLASDSPDDLRPILDEELQRLPEKYRAPLVLHYLEGKSKQEAANQLGWTEGTVSGRLDRARKLLRRRLLKRGIGLSAGFLASMDSTPSVLAMVPQALQESALRAAIGFASSPAAAGAASTLVTSLAEAVLRGMFMTRIKFTVSLLLLAGLVASGTGLTAHYVAGFASSAVQPGDPPSPLAHKGEEPAQNPPPPLAQEQEPPPPEEPDEFEEPGPKDIAVARLEAISPERWEASWKTDLEVIDQPAGPVLRRLTRELGLSMEASETQERDLERTMRLKLRGRSRLEMVEEVCRRVGLYPVYSDDVLSWGDSGKTIHLKKGPRPWPVTFAGPFRVTVEGMQTEAASGTGELRIRFLALGLPPAVALPLSHEKPIPVQQVIGPGGQSLLNRDKLPNWTGTESYAGLDVTEYLDLKGLDRDLTTLHTLAGTLRVPLASRVDSARFSPLESGTAKTMGDVRVTLRNLSLGHQMINGENRARHDFDFHFRGTRLYRLAFIGHDARGGLLHLGRNNGGSIGKGEGQQVVGFLRRPFSITVKLLAEIKHLEYPFHLENVPLSSSKRLPEKAGKSASKRSRAEEP